MHCCLSNNARINLPSKIKIRFTILPIFYLDIYIHCTHTNILKMAMIIFHRCADLESYAAEQKCKCILLLNKADLTSEYLRKCWAEYFTKQVLITKYSLSKPLNDGKLFIEFKGFLVNSALKNTSIR